jgi:hypothetical protein
LRRFFQKAAAFFAEKQIGARVIYGNHAPEQVEAGFGHCRIEPTHA